MTTQANPSGKTALADVIAAHAEVNPAASAFIAGDRTLTWAQYHQRSNQLAGVFINRGIPKGERVALLLPDSPETHVAYVACEKAGVIGMDIPPRAGEKEIHHLLAVSGAVALLSLTHHGGRSTTEFFEQLKTICPSLQQHLVMEDKLDREKTVTADGEVIDTTVTHSVLSAINDRRAGSDDLFLLNTTSGTTGMPKCVKQHQRRWFAYAELAQDTAELTSEDVFLRAVPASVGFGLWTGHFIPALLGATTVILPKFTVENLLDAVQRHKVTVLAAVSTQFIMVLNQPKLNRYDLSSLRIMYTGGEAVPRDRAVRFEEATGATVLQFYGSNETGALSYTTVRDGREKRLTTAGRVIPDMHVRLIDGQERDITDTGRGQPVCKGPAMCQGYFNDPEANSKLYTRDGYMKMEDVVTIDGEGYLKVIGRVGDFIVRGGKNISAVAVEEAVLAHPRVKMTAAVAMPDPVFGERVCAYVVHEAGPALTLQELAAFLTTQGISKEYFPEKLVLMAELPTVSGGKIAKQVLREDIKQRITAEREEKTTHRKNARPPNHQ